MSPTLLRAQRRLACATALSLGLHSAHAHAQGVPGTEGFANTPNPLPGSGAGMGNPGGPAPDATGDAIPRLERFVRAEYPPEARAQGLQATVLLVLTLDASGRVSDVQIAEPAGHGFDEAAVAAVRQFEFSPARQNGQPVGARIRYRYRFTLDGAEPQAPAAPSAVVHGVVRDAQNRPLGGAGVTARVAGATTELRATTDAAGSFRLELSNVGDVTVTVRAPNFRDFRAIETVQARDDLQVIYRLTPTAAEAPSAGVTAGTAGDPATEPEQGVTVRGQRPPREVTRTTLERRELLRIPGTGGDALRAIQNLPGLSRPPFLSGALLVRGAAPQDTQVFADGTAIPLLYHFGGLSSTIQTEMLDRIDFYPGNFSSRFGRAMGGVVDVGLRSPRTRGYHGVANVNLIDASLFVEGAITPTLSVALAARRSYVDVVLNAVLSNVQGVGVRVAPVYYDYQGVLEWRPLPRHRFRLAVFGTDDALSVLFRNPSDAAPTFAGGVSFNTRYHIAQLSYVHDLGPGTQGRAMVSTGIQQLDIAASELFRFELNVLPVVARYELGHTVSPQLRIDAGIDMSFGRASTELRAPGLGPNAGSSSADRVATSFSTGYYQPAAYVEAEVTPLRGLRIVPSLRVDYFKDIQTATLSPRMNARWDIAGGWALKGGIGMYTQPPSFQQSTNAPNTLAPGGQLLGNPQLAPQRAMHYALGLERRFTPLITASLEGFYKSLDDLVITTPAAVQARDPSSPPYLSSGIGRVYGLEVMLRHKSSERFFGWLAYTLMRSERRPTPQEPWRLFQYDQTHILTVLGSYRIGWGIEAGLRFRYVTGSPTTPIVSAYYNTATMTYSAISGPAYSVRNSDFHQLDVRVDKTWRFDWGSFGVFLEVLNVYNNGNQEGVQYNYNYTASQPIVGIPIFPNLGVRGEI